MLVDQDLWDQLVDQVQTSKLLAGQLRKQLVLEKESQQDEDVHDEGIEPPQTAV